MTKDDFIKNLGENIVQERKRLGITQEQLANRIELHDSALRRIEKGRINSSIWVISKIAKELNIEVSELIKYSDLQNSKK